MNRGMHWGPLLFTLAVALAAMPIVGARLLTPLAPPVGAPAASSNPTAEVDPAQLRSPLPEELHAEWYTQTVAPVISVGGTTDVTVQFRNVGHTPWIRGAPSEVRLGEVGPRPLPPEMRLDWLAWDRPAAQSEPIVDERQIATFSFKVAGAAPGTYRLNLRPVVDGVAWLKDEGVHINITVRE